MISLLLSLLGGRATATAATILSVAAAWGFILFLVRMYNARQYIYKLQKAGMAMPPYHPIAGHFLVLAKYMKQNPADLPMHLVFDKIGREFPDSFYVDLWPYNRPILVVKNPENATKMQEQNPHYGGFIDAVAPKLDIVTGGPSILTMRGNEWKRWRGVFNPGFSSGYMLELVPLIAREVMDYRDTLLNLARAGKMFELEDLTLRMTIDVIGAVSMDIRLNHQQRDHPMASALRTLLLWTTYGTILNPFKRYLSVRRLVQWYNSKIMNKHIHAEIDKRWAELQDEKSSSMSGYLSKKSKSILSLVLKAYRDELEEQGASTSRTEIDPGYKQVITSQLRIFLFAGHDTTSSTLIFSYHCLATHPEWLARIREEHDKVFGPDAAQAYQTIVKDPARLNGLPETLAVIKEALRLYPPASKTSEGHAGLDMFNEHDRRYYPTEGSDVWVLLDGLHRNPRYWKEPNKFLPERWLVGAEDPLHPAKGAWRPFSFGPRNCIGQTLAVMELKIALVMTLRELDFLPAYDEWDRLNPGRKKGIRTFDGQRAYPCELGGGGAHPSDGYPCRVSLRKG